MVRALKGSTAHLGPALLAAPGDVAPRHVAIVDGGSYVLPYVHALATALQRRGHRVTVYASRTRYNGEFLAALRDVEGIEVIDAAVSRTVAPRWRGVLGYAGLLWSLWRHRARYDTVNLQFPILGLLEWPVWLALGRRFVFTVHNAVPHGHAGRRHAATAWTARLARALVFASHATRDDFLRRYGAQWADRATVMPHGLLPLAPAEPPAPYRLPVPPRALVYWSTVKPYKGVELFADLARSPALKARGMALEVHGRWDADLQPLKEELVALGVTVVDRYLEPRALRELMARPVLFVLPYREASQSGALYTLLHQGAYFCCTDAGDLGDFMRRHGLDAMLMPEPSTAAVLRLLDGFGAQPQAWQQAFADAQRASGWDAALDAAAGVYDAAP